MKVKAVTFFFFSFPFLCFSSEALKTSVSVQKETEASFSFKCDRCEQSEISALDGNCLLKLQSKECQSLAEEERVVCGKDGDFRFSETGTVIKNCLQKTLSSFLAVFDLLWYAVKYSSSLFLEPDKESHTSSKHYIAIEFYKIYREAKGSELERALKAASVIGGQAFSMVWNGAKTFLEREYNVFGCYKTSIKAEIICSFAVGLAIPGGSAFSVAKLGIKGTKSLRKTRKLFNAQKRKESKSASFNLLSKLEKKVLKPSALLKSKTRLELNSFFQAMDKGQFANQLQQSISRIRLTRGSVTPEAQRQYRKQMREAVILALTTGTTSVKLSKEAVAILVEGVTDSMLTTYINEQMTLSTQTELTQKK